MNKMISKTVIVRRFKITNNYSLGKCYIKDFNGTELFIGVTLERGWLDNKNNISCIPEGVYSLNYEYSPKFNRMLWEIYGVPNRAECKFHPANYWRQLNGCIAIGEKHIDINSDGDPDITNSKISIAKFNKELEGMTGVMLEVYNI